MKLIKAAVLLGALASVTHAKDGDWVQEQTQRSWLYMLANISPPGAREGAVVASPSRSDPNYWFHWTRDAAIVMDVVAQVHASKENEALRDHTLNMLMQYLAFTIQIQNTPTKSGGPGEPKFYPDGRAFDDDWGRPQNDGPALRAISLLRFARTLLRDDQTDWVRQYMFGEKQSAIRVDLDYIALHWSDPDYDIWEEVKGEHFFNRLVQRRALIEGAHLAQWLGQEDVANHYLQIAKRMSYSFIKFFDTDRGWIIPTLNRVGGLDKKASALDMSVILGVLHGQTSDGFLLHSNAWVLATAQKLMDTFQGIYSINALPDLKGIAIGRYPEDTYDGLTTKGIGNPWFISTLAMAELHQKISKEWRRMGFIRVEALSHSFFTSLCPHLTFELNERILPSDSRYKSILNALAQRSSDFLERVRAHSDQETGALSEQFNRETGFMQGATHLTWSYASFLTNAFAMTKQKP